MNLSNLTNLHVFCLFAFVNCKPSRKRKAPRNVSPFAVLHYINTVLGTIPEFNRVANLWFDFTIFGDRRPFRGCLDQDWVGMFNEVIRISRGKPLELELQMVVSDGLEAEHPGEDELYKSIMENAASLSDYPKFCTHLWNPTFWSRGLRPFQVPRGQVRGRCRR